MTDKHFDSTDKFFAHERLVAYDLALQTVRFVAARRAKLRGLPGQAGPQLERAVVGAHTNLCAGAAQDGAEARRDAEGRVNAARCEHCRDRGGQVQQSARGFRQQGHQAFLQSVPRPGSQRLLHSMWELE